MITFERSHNLDLVRSILIEPRIWPHVGDDFAPQVHQFQPPDDPRIWYVIAIEDEEAIGLFSFFPESPVCWQVHVAMHRDKWGKVAHRAGREIVPWIWANTECRRITAQAPQSNRAAVYYGLKAMRLKKYGINEKSFLKHGRLWDQVLLGISRPEEK